MSECDNQTRRGGDHSMMAKAANSASLALASRGALLIVVSLVAFIAYRSLSVLDVMAADIRSLSKEVAIVVKDIALVTQQNASQEHRIEKIENRLLR